MNQQAGRARPTLGRAMWLILFAVSGAWGQPTTLFEDQILVPVDTMPDHLFGRSVAVDGEWAVVGAPHDDENGFQAGAAYVYQWEPGSGWVEHTKLLASEGETGDVLGFSVAIDGERIVAGAWNDSENGIESGSATVFAYDGSAWLEVQQLVPSDGEESDQFGWSVGIDGEIIAVGARVVDLPLFGLGHGAVYPFREVAGTWVEEPRLTSSSPGSSDFFGFDVSVSEGAIAVAAVVTEIEVFRDLPGGWTADPTPGVRARPAPNPKPRRPQAPRSGRPERQCPARPAWPGEEAREGHGARCRAEAAPGPGPPPRPMLRLRRSTTASGTR